MITGMKAKLAEFAAKRHGVFLRDDALRHGHTSADIRRYLSRGDWVRVAPETYVAASTPITLAARAEMARRSMPHDYAFSHLFAAQLWGLKAPAPTTIDVVIDDRDRVRREGIVIRRVRPRMLGRRRCRNGLWVTDLETTILHCAAVLPYDDLVTLVEDALRRGLTTLARLYQRLGRGLSGAAALRKLLEELDDGFHDRWTRRLIRALVRRGAPKPKHGTPIVDPVTGRTIRPDAVWEELRILGEVDDWATHGSRSAQERDRRRDRWVYARFGYVVIRTTPREIRRNLDQVVTEFLEVLERAAARTAAA